MSKENYHQIRAAGTNDGELKFGHLTDDNEIDSVLIKNNREEKHYIALQQTGEPHRTGGTLCRSPGSFQVVAGDRTPEEQPGIYLEASSGDVIIRAPSGKVRIEGVDIELTANGYDGTTGNVNISASEKVILNAGQMVDIQSKVETKIVSEKTVTIIGRSVLNIYGGFIDMVDGDAVANPLGSLNINVTEFELAMAAEGALKALTRGG